jgi:cytochrome c5
MQDNAIGSASSGAPAPGAAVSSNNPCPFLRAAVASGFLDGHVVPVSKLVSTVEAASGEKGVKAKLVGVKTWLVAVVANGLSPPRLLRNWRSGAELDALRNGPLDKRGSGSRILDATAHVSEPELARLADFGKDRPNPAGGTERGLTAAEIKTYMDANFERAKGSRRQIDRKLMDGEFPVLLSVMGKGEGDERYLSVAEVRTLFVERRLPDRIAGRLMMHAGSSAPGGGPLRTLAKAVIVILALLGALVVAIAEFPDQVRKVAPSLLAQLLPPTLPALAPVKAAVWLDQNWSTEDRHWFHHASQGTASFPVPYAWFVALEQPGLHLFTRPGLLSDSAYLQRFGFLPSPKSVRADETSLDRFGYSTSPAAAEPIPPSVAGLRPTPVENFDGLPVGFARLTGAVNPGTGQPESDKIGLTCAACHTGHISYKGTSVRFDGGPGMLELKQLERATGLSILYTLKVWGRFDRFATRVLGPNASRQERDKLRQELSVVMDFLHNQLDVVKATLKAKSQADTDEGFGRLDALNRIGNQVFYTDLAAGGLSGYEKNIHANDAPVSFPPIWTVPWLLWAQYDGSIEQPLIRNAGEALGVSALVNMSPDPAPETLFRSSVAIENLVRIEEMLRGPDPFGRTPKSFGGLAPPKWPSQLFPDDPAWKVKPERVAKGRAIYAEICAECHLGPVNDANFDTQFPDKAFWSSDRWDSKGPVLKPVQKSVKGMGTDSAQGDVLSSRTIYVPGFLKLQPATDLGTHGPCANPPDVASTEMPFSVALMMVVDRVSRKWMDDHNLSDADRLALWGPRKNCPNPVDGPHYRARPLNGVWATAPYLHNGSVPSLYWMLKPAAERPTKFCLGARDFDPEQVGYRVVAGEAPSCNKGETLFATTDSDGKAIHGNSVMGHSLEGTPGPGKPGVIGRMLKEEERFDLIDYLKTL